MTELINKTIEEIEEEEEEDSMRLKKIMNKGNKRQLIPAEKVFKKAKL